jgi:hypothetical protein
MSSKLVRLVLLGHFVLNEKISADTGRKPEILHNPAGHAFSNEEDLLGTYDAEQARIAWDRSLTFLGAHLGKGLLQMGDVFVAACFARTGVCTPAVRNPCAVHEILSYRFHRFAYGPRNGNTRKSKKSKWINTKHFECWMQRLSQVNRPIGQSSRPSWPAHLTRGADQDRTDIIRLEA